MVVKQNKQNWVGKPAFMGSKYDILKTHKQDYPVNMFGDKDRDGVANVFDCNPNNPNRQGIVSAIVGAVGGLFKGEKGSVKKGWQEGMVKPGVIAKYRTARREAKIRRFTSSPEEKARQTLPGQQSSYEKYKQIEEAKAARIARYKQIPKKVVVGVTSLRSHGGFTSKVLAPAEYLTKFKEQLKSQKFTRQQRAKISTVKKAARMLFPVIPVEATTVTYGQQGKGIKQGGGRGRPRGSLDPRYAQYGGVFGYRRAMSAQRAAFRERLRQQQEMMRQQRQMQRMPQYEKQQYQQAYPQQQVQQVPQEVAGATPDYSQFEEMQGQVPQQVQQYQPQPQQMPQPQYPQQGPQSSLQDREIVPVFRSSGGKPYPAVERTKLASPRETIPFGYVETVDSFTGRRFLKRLPQAEGWIKPR